jgi:phosphomannomutase
LAHFRALGIEVIDLGLSTTPTVEIAVPLEKAGGGIILTASHNPKQWNALKLLNEKGEFISDADGKELLDIAEKAEFSFADVDDLGKVTNKRYVFTETYRCRSCPAIGRRRSDQSSQF